MNGQYRETKAIRVEGRKKMRSITSEKGTVLCEVQKITSVLCSLPPVFGETLSFHMKHRCITNEALAEALGISARQISRLRNEQVPTLKLSLLVAICVCLQLEPELSEDLILKSGQHFLPIEEHVFYRYLLRSMYRDSLESCNQVLQEAGYPVLCSPH